MEKLTSSDARSRSRRDFVAKAAAFLAAAGVADKVNLEAQTLNSDTDILNFALRLENLEATFYQQGLAKFAGGFGSAGFAGTLTPGQLTAVTTNLQQILAQEKTHVMQITQMITAAGGTAVGPDCYGFSPYGTDLTTLKTPDSFIAAAMTLENTGVSAYDGAINLIQSASLRTAAATIATVEARHAAYLNILNGQSPFPAAFDPTLGPADVLTAASKYITSCAVFPPNANPGATTVTTSSNPYSLDGTASTSADGSPIASYLWQVALGNQAVIAAPASPKTTINFHGGPGFYSVALMVTDIRGNNSTTTVTINYKGA